MAKKKHRSGLQKFLEDHRVMTYTNQDGAVDKLDLRLEETTDEVLGLLQELPSLRRITLQGARITDRGLAHLSQLGQLEDLDLRSCKHITDAGMKHVSKLSKLTNLQLYNTRVGDKALGHLLRLENLESLDLHSTKVTDLGLNELQKLPRLRFLDIGGKGPTDAGLRYVGRLHQLERLELAESSFTDLGLGQLKRLTRLTHLFIARTRITGVGFKHLGDLQRLELLHASQTRFSDKGLKYLAPLKRLKSLALDGTNVSDLGLKHLKSLERLKDLGLEDTQVTKHGKADLKKALPRCVIQISTDQGQVKLEEYDEEYFWSHPPRCVAGFRLKALRKHRPTTYQLACSCGSEAGTLLGFPLSHYNRDYKGNGFVGPMAFRCARCRKNTAVIDTNIHGYHGELGSSATIRGRGKRIAYRCAKCRSDDLSVIVHFEYGGGELDLKEDEPSITVEDFFGSFSVFGICDKCGARNTIASIECA